MSPSSRELRPSNPGDQPDSKPYDKDDKPVRVAWADKRAHLKCVPGRCIDVSDRRIHIEVPEQIPLSTRVTLRAGRIPVPRPAVVKYVTQCDTKFILVLEWIAS